MVWHCAMSYFQFMLYEHKKTVLWLYFYCFGQSFCHTQKQLGQNHFKACPKVLDFCQQFFISQSFAQINISFFYVPSKKEYPKQRYSPFFYHNPCTYPRYCFPHVTFLVGSNQATLGHTKVLTQCCCLPTLTRFISFCCTGLHLQHQRKRADHTKQIPQTGIVPTIADCGLQGTANAPTSTEIWLNFIHCPAMLCISIHDTMHFCQWSL